MFVKKKKKNTSSLRSLKEKRKKKQHISNQLPSVNSRAAKGSSAGVFQTSKPDQLHTAPSGAGPPSPPPPRPSVFVAIANFRKKEIVITKTHLRGKKSQLQTRYATTLRHDQGREGGQKKDRKNVSKLLISL